MFCIHQRRRKGEISGRMTRRRRRRFFSSKSIAEIKQREYYVNGITRQLKKLPLSPPFLPVLLLIFVPILEMPKCLKETADQAPYRPRPDAPVSEVGYMKETEIGIAAVEEMTLVAFQQMEEQWGETGSPWRRFYEQVSALPDRVVAWNTNKYDVLRFLSDIKMIISMLTRFCCQRREYTPEHIFFRSVDTGRLLAMDNGPFRVQVSKGRHQTGNDKVLLAGMVSRHE